MARQSSKVTKELSAKSSFVFAMYPLIHSNVFQIHEIYTSQGNIHMLFDLSLIFIYLNIIAQKIILLKNTLTLLKHGLCEQFWLHPAF
jgi:hypothetical protein